MHNECFSHMTKMLQKDIPFSRKVQMVRQKWIPKWNLNVPFYSLVSPSNTKYENKENTQKLPRATTHISNRKRQWTSFQLVVA